MKDIAMIPVLSHTKSFLPLLGRYGRDLFFCKESLGNNPYPVL